MDYETVPLAMDGTQILLPGGRVSLAELVFVVHG